LPPELLELLGVGYADLLVWVACLVLVIPVVTLVHELGHAAAALRFTSRHVVIQLYGRPLRDLHAGRLHLVIALPGLGGCCAYAEPSSRRGEVAISAAGPFASFATGAAAAGGWLATSWVPVGALAAVSLVVALRNAFPTRQRYDGEWHVSDGMWVARELGLVRPPRHPSAPLGSEPILSWPYAVLLAPVLILVVATQPAILLLLMPLFALGWIISVQDREAAAPLPPETWDTGDSVAPPGPR
jgi:hypothetical protein